MATRNVILACLAFWFLVAASAEDRNKISVQPEPSPLSGFRPFDAALLDEKTFAQWMAGFESPASPASWAKSGPQNIVWTQSVRPDWRGLKYGEGKDGGVRHLRIGFTKPVAVGSALVSGGGALSFLKADASYPGDLADESQWVPAERLLKGAASQAEVAEGEYGMWVLPPGSSTRALRFTHNPAAGDRENACMLGGLWILPDRMGNVAPQALVQTRARDDVSAKLVDESFNQCWKAWDNGETGAALTVSPEHPEIITMTWPAAVRISGLCLLWKGFSSVDVDVFVGGLDESVRNAPNRSWQRVAADSNPETYYPSSFGPHWMTFDQPVVTRALRLRIVDGFKSAQGLHGHLAGKIVQGRRVWLGEIMVLAPLKNAQPLQSLVLPAQRAEPPPIPIKFHLPEAGLVTLVIEDMSDHRVRNLVSETPFPAGENIAWWDGSDDLLRDPEAAKHGVYNIPTRPVAPGQYKVRGLWHKPISLKYEFSVYNAGRPAWETADKTGCWMTNHTPPTSVVWIPGGKTADGLPLVAMGAYVSEGGHGLQWLREDGTKVGGQGWVGGTWTGAPTLAVDRGANAVPEHACYVGSVWESELRLTAKTRDMADKPVFKIQLGSDPTAAKPGHDAKVPLLPEFDGGQAIYVLAGIAVHDGTVVCSMVRQNELIFVDARQGKITERWPVDNPRGVAFDAQGNLLVLSGTKLLRFPPHQAKPETVLASGLEDPRHVVVDNDGNFLISDRGISQQVKGFSAAGKLMRSVGHAGAPHLGKYDEAHMNNPNGLTLDSQGRLWVAEADNFPRRVSVWSRDGALERAFYGPTEYGGGGVLDPQDATKFYYKGVEFALDWQTGTDRLMRVFSRPDPLLAAHAGQYSPDYPLYPDGAKGQRYFTSCYTHVPTSGDHAAFLWRDDGDAARLVAGFGDAHHFPVLRAPEFRSCWPEGTKPEEDQPSADRRATFAWSDLNGDGRPQPEEVKMLRQMTRGVTVMNDLSFIAAQHGRRTARFSVHGMNPRGVPSYDLFSEVLGPAGGNPPSSGGEQALVAGDWVINTNAPTPFSPYSIGGSYKSEARWSYPSAWPGLHASHEAAVPDRPGMIIGHTRLLGDCISGKLGPMFCINGNMGNMYLLTADGLFVSTLFHDIRLRSNWAAPVAKRGMDVTDVSLHDENFWPSITQTPDGKVFLVDGARTSLVRIDGLETLQRIPEQVIDVTSEDLAKAREWFARSEAARQKKAGTGILDVAIRKTAPIVDGKLDDWPLSTEWANIDRRGTAANFNSNSKPYEVSAAACISGGRLFAAWRTAEKNLLDNTGENADAPFKTGGCLDLMLQTNTEERLLVTLIKGTPHAVLYRAKVSGSKNPVRFASPWRSINFDAVEDVSDKVSFATDGNGNFEISVPLGTLHWAPKTGDVVSADIGVLRGNGGQTTQRIYWSNKATAITADVPSEAELTPKLWGKWKLRSE